MRKKIDDIFINVQRSARESGATPQQACDSFLDTIAELNRQRRTGVQQPFFTGPLREWNKLSSICEVPLSELSWKGKSFSPHRSVRTKVVRTIDVGEAT
jgi:hypothetical protein